MTSQARKNFDKNFEDVEHLIGMGQGMRILEETDGECSDAEVNVLYRSALVLMISHWEAYIEDICAEALSHIVEATANPDKLPKEIRKKIGKEIKNIDNDIEAWKLAGEGWKDYLKQRESKFSEERNRSFNTPKPEQTNLFIENVIGLKNVTSSWKIEGSTEKESAERLKKLVELRGQIAHRGKLNHELTEDWLLEEVKFLKKVVSKTGGKINSHVKKSVGTGLW